MTKPESYPYLRIAREFGVDYDTVLEHAANTMKGGINYIPREVSLADQANYVHDMREAHQTFLRIRAGLIDWNTGEPIYRQFVGRATRHESAPPAPIFDFRQGDGSRPLNAAVDPLPGPANVSDIPDNRIDAAIRHYMGYEDTATFSDIHRVQFREAIAIALGCSQSEPSEPTHYVYKSNWGTVYVKDAELFREQGGLTEEWGERWKPIVASSIEHARELAKSSLLY